MRRERTELDLLGDVVVDDEESGLLDGEDQAVHAGALDDGGVGDGGAELELAGADAEGRGGAVLVQVVLPLQRRLHVAFVREWVEYRIGRSGGGVCWCGEEETKRDKETRKKRCGASERESEGSTSNGGGCLVGERRIWSTC